jgi:hypothetical protein
MARSQANLVHAGLVYDLELDTAQIESLECARIIAARIDQPLATLPSGDPHRVPSEGPPWVCRERLLRAGSEDPPLVRRERPHRTGSEGLVRLLSGSPLRVSSDGLLRVRGERPHGALSGDPPWVRRKRLLRTYRERPHGTPNEGRGDGMRAKVHLRRGLAAAHRGFL